MDGFLVKPISRDRLAEAIDQVLGNYSDGMSDRPASLTAKPTTKLQFDEVNNLEEEDQPPARLDAELTIETADATDPRRISVEQAFANAPHWEQLVELMHGNESLLRDVLSLLVREAPRLGRSFQTGLKDGNFSETRRAVHTLKSNVRYVGLKEIGHYAQWLEHLARDQQSELLHDHAENLCSLADAVADWAEQQLKSH
ncbi:MAG: Hpt domain-containing protein [Pirellulaceae bacterium]